MAAHLGKAVKLCACNDWGLGLVIEDTHALFGTHGGLACDHGRLFVACLERAFAFKCHRFATSTALNHDALLFGPRWHADIRAHTVNTCLFIHDLLAVFASCLLHTKAQVRGSIQRIPSHHVSHNVCIS